MKKIEAFGKTVIIPNGYSGPDEDGEYIDGHGVSYALVKYGSGEDAVICLESVYSRHTRTVELKEA